MTLTLTVLQTYSAVGPGMTVSFGASNGTGPYTYAVMPGGAGGEIDTASGIYTSPAVVPVNPAQAYDIITVTDFLGNTGTGPVLVGTPLILVCEILQKELGLTSGHCYVWNQKLFQPKDSALYIAVSVVRCRPFGNVNAPTSGNLGLNEEQYIAMQATLDLDIMSRGPAARDRKEEVLLALSSTYSIQQQEANSFSIARLPQNGHFNNLSYIDGAAIPYRFKTSINITYAFAKTNLIDYMANFPWAAYSDQEGTDISLLDSQGEIDLTSEARVDINNNQNAQSMLVNGVLVDLETEDSEKIEAY